MIERIVLGLVGFAAIASSAPAGEPTWRKRDINPASVFEAAGVFDVDGDGKLDIVSGESWYRGPEFKEVFKTREVSKTGTYRNCFATLPVDANGDGKMDYVTCSYFGQDVGWVENPGKAGEAWTYHPIDKPGSSEAAVAVDLTGDGVPDFLPNTTNVVTFYTLDKKGAEPAFKKFDLGTRAAGHGVGHGDINADGRTDILTPKGWFEATANPEVAGWIWHGEWNIGAPGISILSKDVDGDGLMDLIYGQGHNRGLFWLKQAKGSGDERTWGEPISIDPTLSSVHTLIWADLDGDGKKDELVTGKRVYAHEIEAGDVEASQVAYYTFDRESKSWTKHPIYKGEPALNAPKEGGQRDAQKDFPKGTAGTGLQMTAIDIDGDGDLDLVCPGKSGLYLFENLGKNP